MTDPFELPNQWQLLHWKKQIVLANEALVATGKAPKEHMEASEARAILGGMEKQIADTVRAKMATPSATPVVPEGEASVPLRLLRDTWQGTERVRADGKVTMWPLEEAKKLLANKVAERADPLPGDTEIAA